EAGDPRRPATGSRGSGTRCAAGRYVRGGSRIRTGSPGASEGTGRCRAGPAAVLVETPAVVGAGERGDVRVQPGQAALRGDRGRGVGRMGVVHPVDDQGRVQPGAAERDDVVLAW